jgi:hypothetical protein
MDQKDLNRCHDVIPCYALTQIFAEWPVFYPTAGMKERTARWTEKTANKGRFDVLFWRVRSLGKTLIETKQDLESLQ